MIQRLCITLLFLFACTGCNSPEVARNEVKKATIVSTCFPAHYLAQYMAPANVEVQSLLPKGEDAPHWQPNGDLISQAAEGDLIVANGAGYEPWMNSAMLATNRIVWASKDLDLITIKATLHKHGNEGSHTHQGTDPHTFSDPKTYEQQSLIVSRSFVEKWPKHQGYISEKQAELAQKLSIIHKQLEMALKPLKSAHFMSNHPSFNYLAKRHHLSIQNLDLSPTAIPTDEQLAHVKQWTEQSPGNHIILWEESPAPLVVKAFTPEILHLILDPLEQPPTSGPYDYLQQAAANVKAIEAFTSHNTKQLSLTAQQ